MKNYQWMHTKLNYQIDATASGDPYADSFYIDIARGLSLLNRKLIRQGQLFKVKGLRVYQAKDTDNRRVMVSTIPTNWVARNAWVKGKALWDKMNALAVEDLAGSTLYPKYHDYKVYMNAAHKTDHASAEHVPCDADSNDVATTSSEWKYSEYASSKASESDNYDVKMLGTHDGSTGAYTCVSLIDAYRQSRVRPQLTDPVLDPNIITSPWAELFGDDDQTSDIITNLNEDNDAPPYPPSIYIGDGTDDGGFAVGSHAIQKSGSGGSITFPTFVAPCGLIRIEIDDDGAMTNETMHISFDVEILGPMDM